MSDLYDKIKAEVEFYKKRVSSVILVSICSQSYRMYGKKRQE